MKDVHSIYSSLRKEEKLLLKTYFNLDDDNFSTFDYTFSNLETVIAKNNLSEYRNIFLVIAHKLYHEYRLIKTEDELLQTEYYSQFQGVNELREIALLKKEQNILDFSFPPLLESIKITLKSPLKSSKGNNAFHIEGKEALDLVCTLLKNYFNDPESSYRFYEPLTNTEVYTKENNGTTRKPSGYGKLKPYKRITVKQLAHFLTYATKQEIEDDYIPDNICYIIGDLMVAFNLDEEDLLSTKKKQSSNIRNWYKSE